MDTPPGVGGSKPKLVELRDFWKKLVELSEIKMARRRRKILNIYALKCMFSLRKSTFPSAKMLFSVRRATYKLHFVMLVDVTVYNYNSLRH